MQGVFAESLLRKEGRVGCVHENIFRRKVTDIAFPSDFCNNHSHPCVPVFVVPASPYLTSRVPAPLVPTSHTWCPQVLRLAFPSLTVPTHVRFNVPVPVLYTAVYFVTLRQHLTEQYTILSGKREISMDLPTSMRNNSYLLTLQANFATICLMRKHPTPTLPDYFLFLLESQAKVLTNQGTKSIQWNPALRRPR